MGQTSRAVSCSFAAHAHATPDAPAVIESSGVTTYGALARLVAGLTARFVETGARRILIALPPGAHAYAAMLASLRSGATYSPLNVSSPEHKRRTIARRFRPDLVLGDNATLAAIRDESLDAIFISRDEIDAPVGDVVDMPPPVESAAPAYVIFTSGSTGVPKGVVIGRAALAHYVSWLGEALDITPSDRVSQYANIAFDLSVLEIFGALCHGASLYPPAGLADRMRPAQMIAREALTLWVSVPSAVGLMLQAGEVSPDLLGSVRRFVFCGEKLLPHHAAGLLRAVPGAEIQNTYGPTEATVSMTSVVFGTRQLASLCRQSVAIGDPIPGMSIVLDGPEADSGEIVIVGPQLADGYFEDAAATDRAFRPVETGAGAVRGYFTGDRAERRDGQIFFVERLDFQIKHKGFRIETGEIVAAFAAIGYEDVCVFQAGGQLVAALESASPVDIPALRRALSARLDAYAVPDAIRPLPRLPRTENGKIDRAALIASVDGTAVAPASPAATVGALAHV